MLAMKNVTWKIELGNAWRENMMVSILYAGKNYSGFVSNLWQTGMTLMLRDGSYRNFKFEKIEKLSAKHV